MRRTACAGELRLDAATTAAAASLLCERRRPHATGGCASSTMAAQPSAAAYQTMEMRMAAAPPSRAPAHEQPQPPKILTGQHRRQNVLSMKMYSGTSGVGAPDKSRVMPSTISVRSRSRGGPWRAHGGRRASVVPPAVRDQQESGRAQVGQVQAPVQWAREVPVGAGGHSKASDTMQMHVHEFQSPKILRKG